ncbi:hypothetical protein JO972_12095 [Verrucomicrobiaceae bacterium 5K15]|uniref:Uncharacterized protein n=1 Tax=Oceaniferula flava TaxID=2800421 RepID=A0AAE2VCJ4_9BACT|nr:hypothetical protein [Oceaniferula flavus]MBK1855705.1 hypothetical protein [Oceaniferula flavus]MBM1137011.1 hypothetical protein [Oceaniferula flavus]
MSPQAKELIQIVQNAALRHSIFQKRGPGEGNRVTNAVMGDANKQVRLIFGDSAVEQAFVPGVRQSIDYYLEETAEAIEVEFSLPNPYPCLEKDSFKVLLARERGINVKRLILVGPPGSRSRLSAPAPTAIIAYLRDEHDLEVTVCELNNVV